MTKPKPPPQDRERNAHPIRWGGADWEAIKGLADILTVRDGNEWTPTSVIRKAVRGFLAQHHVSPGAAA